METVFIYTILVGGAIFLCPLVQLLLWLRSRVEMIRRQLINRHVIGRHCLGIGPFTWASMILCLLYISLNIFFMFYPGGLTLDKRRRCGILALSNMIILYASPSMSYLSDLMMIRLRTWRYIHRAAGWMMCAQTGGHIIFSLTSTESVSPGETAAISGIIVSSNCISTPPQTLVLSHNIATFLTNGLK